MKKKPPTMMTTALRMLTAFTPLLSAATIATYMVLVLSVRWLQVRYSGFTR